jgi:hypothetical protein
LLKTFENSTFMRKFVTPLVVSLLLVSAPNLHGSQSNQQGGEQNTSPQQQHSPQTSHPQASSNAAAQSVTGCLVQLEREYSLKTDTDTYPIETEKDLSQFVHKQTDIRLRINIKGSNASSLRLSLVGSGGKPVWRQQLPSGFPFAGNDRVVVLVAFAFQRSISWPAVRMDYATRLSGMTR